ncbi:flavodoxin [Suttonella ornithocola]|uniref:Flavodoxin n=1 Tax=Suttonella ornithocola TaxID=279832 RepID=A0A380MXS5_9GAMM|nr:flavodoxin [Suttonella ornithocola]SUO97082.1 Flavodoxin [Suttonella ornithocola]
MSEEIGFFYGSTTGMTEDVAFQMEKIAKEQHGITLTPINIIDLDDPNDMFLYKKIILGMPTWNYGEYQDDWEMVVDQIVNADLNGITIAMFGLGDQVGYPEYYLDAMGMLGDQLAAQGATFIGQWPIDGYEFTSSKALKNGQFLGLALDEDSQPEKTAERIETWLAQVLPQFASL